MKAARIRCFVGMLVCLLLLACGALVAGPGNHATRLEGSTNPDTRGKSASHGYLVEPS
jgi:hypothetical protein